MPVRRLEDVHDSRETEYPILETRLVARMLLLSPQHTTHNTEFARASFVAIINKVVEFVENVFDTFYI